MNVLDSRLDALAISYLSYGFLTAVNNIWALVAVIAAALSFWRIRDSSPPSLDSRCQQQSSNQGSTPLERFEVKEDQPAPAMTTAAACYASEGVGSPKVKFSVHYNEDCFRGSDDDEAENDGGGCGGAEADAGSEKLWFCGGDFDKMMAVRMGDMGWYKCQDLAVRMGDMGWYKCQDLAVLDGSVVRLWDGRRRRRGASALAEVGGVVWW